jgi:hypothetical protein
VPLKVGDPMPMGGVFLDTQKSRDTEHAIRAVLKERIARVRFGWDADSTALWVAYDPILKKRKAARSGVILQQAANALLFIPNDGWWPTDEAGVVAAVDEYSRRCKKAKKRLPFHPKEILSTLQNVQSSTQV